MMSKFKLKDNEHYKTESVSCQNEVIKIAILHAHRSHEN